MKLSGLSLLSFLLLYGTALTDEKLTVIGEMGESILLPCLDLPINKTPSVTQWKKDGVVLYTRNHSVPENMDQKIHISILDNSSLIISGLMKIDGAEYECDTEPPSDTHHTFELLITEGPKNTAVELTPAKTLANGTWFVPKGSTVTFECSSMSFPSQNLTWTYEDLTEKENKTRAFGSQSSLHFEIFNIQPVDQRNYTCLAQNDVSKKTEARRIELLVYYISELHPDCFWHYASQGDQVLFNCSWYGSYPTPNLTVFLDSQTDRKPKLYSSQETENFELLLNRSMLYEGQNITCVGQHVAQKPGDLKNCTFTFAAPYPTGPPMVAALEGMNITLKCTELKSLPPAKTIWKRGVKQEPIVPSYKYIIVREGPKLSLTIVNATKDDQGVYFCHSENVLAVKELEVYLTIRSSGDKSGAMVGVFISVFILVAGISMGYFGYINRDRICIGLGFGRLRDDNMDVLNLIESDEEDVFHNAVPRLPPLTNGHVPTPSTTLVEIHQVQSSDHEDNLNDTDLDQTQDQTPDQTEDHT